MEKIIILILAIVSAITAINTSTMKPSTWICDEPPPSVDPEICCDFPNIFNNSIVEKCERDHGKSAGDMMTDSVRFIFEILLTVILTFIECSVSSSACSMSR